MLKKLIQKRNKKGFTLVELIVVIAILGILAAIAVPRLSGFRENAAISADRSSAASISKSADLYVASHNIKSNEIATTDTTDKKLVDLAVLKKADLIANDIKPQNSDGNEFVLNYGQLKKDGVETQDKMFYVTYKVQTGTAEGVGVLFPEGYTKK